MQKNQLKIKQGREADIGKNDNTEKLASRRNVDKEMTIPNRYNLQIIGYDTKPLLYLVGREDKIRSQNVMSCEHKNNNYSNIKIRYLLFLQ